MKKLLHFLDEKLLKWGVAFAIGFIILYPKLPTIHLEHTWVYIRLEDFLILSLVSIWLVQVIRKKVSLPFPVGISIFVYWLAGLVSLIITLTFFAPYLANFFSTVAILSYVRRIEYMLLFFVGFSAVRSEEDIKDFLKALLISVGLVVLYGFGQRWYLFLWQFFPHFFEKFPFCFPSYQTGNEEFAKGLPLCLPFDARITSTFGGHYDLAAYLVMIIPLLFAAFLGFKKKFLKAISIVIGIGSLILLIFTASRISFVAYLLGIICFFSFIKQKKLILPVLIVSIAALFLFNGGTAKRFLQTFSITSVVTDSQGNVVGVAPQSLSAELRSKIAKNPESVILATKPTQNLPAGSSFITLPQISAPEKTDVAVVEKSLTKDKIKQLKLENGGSELSTISGKFLIQEALVYDISFTTRFQAEWPNAWRAFLDNPITGRGFSTITLATDGDYFRLLGETGLFGFLSFMMIFISLGVLVYASGKSVSNPLNRMFVYAISGGIIGVFFNAIFIDVFEASKVSESMWLLVGISTGIIYLNFKDKVNYFDYFKKIFTSSIFIAIVLIVILGIVFFPTVSTYFVADDFTWLRWAANGTLPSIPDYFLNSQGFFYRPFDKILIMILYTFFSFVRPEGYHLMNLFLHFGVALGVFLLIYKILKNKLIASIGSVLFLVHPSHAENVYWISTISTTLSTLFVVYGVLFWFSYREKNNLKFYFFSTLMFICSLFSYEMSVIFPILILITDIFLGISLRLKKNYLPYVLFLVLIVAYYFVRIFSQSVAPGGDYSINWLHFLPNFVGNMFGYIGYYVSGEAILPLYIWLRNDLKSYSLIISLPLGILIISLLIFAGSKIKKIVFQNNIRIYGVLFAVISLIPFIGLGNITGRYVYLASIGFTITVCALLLEIRKRFGVIVIIIISAVLILVLSTGIKQEYLQWKKAGSITEMTLKLLHQNYPKLNAGYRLIFINVPIKYDNAWVFPVGLKDGIWFIYRDDSIKIYSVKDFDAARAIIKDNPSEATRFVFDKYGNLSQVE